LAIAWELLRGDVVDLRVTKATLAAFDRVFGLGLEAWQPKREAIPESVRALAAARAAARAAREWAEADRLRLELHAEGWEMEDGPDGYALKRRSPG
jgi:cysteinyl-tRNA synthetase